jgi:HK97 family phage major capsid protein
LSTATIDFSTTFGEPLPHHVDFAKTGKQRYDLRKALSFGSPAGKKIAAGLEWETSREIAQRYRCSPRGVFIPWDVQVPNGSYSLTSATGGGSIPTVIPGETLWDILRNKMIIARMGGQIADFRGTHFGLLAIPQKSAASTVSWVAETASIPAESNMTTGQALGSIHTTSCFTDVSRQMLETASAGFRNFVTNDLVGSIAHSVDTAALNGLGGGSGQPLGICQRPDVPGFNFANGTPTYKGLTAMKRLASQNNADSPVDCRMGWATSSFGREALEQVDLGGAVGGSGSVVTGRFAWKSHVCRNPITNELEACESLVGQPAVSSESIPSGLSGEGLSNLTPLIYGNWRSVLVQLFTAIDLVEDPYMFAGAGLVRYTAYQAVDVLLMYQAQAFVQSAIVCPNP